MNGLSRFLTKVRRPEVPGGCWEWTAGKNDKGYGSFSDEKGKAIGAHRFSWTQFRGLTYGMGVLHKCDNPGCVNPRHLFLGYQAANMADCAAKGRRTTLIGEGNPRAKLSTAQVLEIRELGHLKATEVAARYGVSASTIKAIRSGRLRRHEHA
jgi:hypothetical protein